MGSAGYRSVAVVVVPGNRTVTGLAGVSRGELLGLRSRELPVGHIHRAFGVQRPRGRLGSEEAEDPQE